MPITEEITLTLENGEEVSCIVHTGKETKQVVFFVGLGPFYLNQPDGYKNGLLELGDDICLVACKTYWTRDKNEPEDKNATAIIEIASDENKMVDFYHRVIKALKLKYGCEKITIKGISAPSSLALVYAQKYPEDVNCVILTGPDLIGGTFEQSNQKMQQEASDRYAKYLTDVENYQAIMEGSSKTKSGKPVQYRTDANFNSSHQLTPNSKWMELVRMLRHKGVDSDNFIEPYEKHWQVGPTKEVIHNLTRETFFAKMHPKLKTAALLEQVAKQTDIPITIIQTKTDYVTAPNLELVMKAKYENWNTINFHTLDDGGHIPYFAHPKYASIIISALAQVTSSNEQTKLLL